MAAEAALLLSLDQFRHRLTMDVTKEKEVDSPIMSYRAVFLGVSSGCKDNRGLKSQGSTARE
jgi:hypothetical protein